jgi:hypothetical protein
MIAALRIARQRRLLTVVAVIALSVVCPAAAPAQTPAPNIKVLVNGTPVTLPQPPVIVRGRVLVPLRGVFERLGATVTWDPLAQTVLAQRGGTTVSLSIGATQAFVNGQAQFIDVPAMLIAGRTMVPLRFIGQALGAGVTWNAATSMVQVTSQGTAAAPAPGAPAGVTAPTAVAVPTATVAVTPAARPLGVGDLLTVTATGPPHATATYTINGLRTALLMSESPTQPGTYVGYYTIRPGDRVTNGNVVVTMTDPNGQIVTANAPVPVTINAAQAVAPAAPGGVAISAPAPVSAVGTPFTVSGTAPPGSRVKVTADYVGSVLFFNVHGSLGTQVVTADANGNWSATFTQAPPVRGVDLTISAAVVDQHGAARSPSMTIHTTIQ